MTSLLLATLLQLAASNLSFSQAEQFAHRDESSLSRELTLKFAQKQGNAVGLSLQKCGTTEFRQAAGVKLVMRLDADGHVTTTWLNKSTKLGNCIEKSMKSFVLPADGRHEFYTFINFSN